MGTCFELITELPVFRTYWLYTQRAKQAFLIDFIHTSSLRDMNGRAFFSSPFFGLWKADELDSKALNSVMLSTIWYASLIQLSPPTLFSISEC